MQKKAKLSMVCMVMVHFHICVFSKGGTIHLSNLCTILGGFAAPFEPSLLSKSLHNGLQLATIRHNQACLVSCAPGEAQPCLNICVVCLLGANRSQLNKDKVPILAAKNLYT